MEVDLIHPSRPRRSAIIRWTAILAAELNVAVHAVLTPMHLKEEPYVGMLFIVGNLAFTFAAVMLVTRRCRVIGWVAAVATSVVEFAGFLASRTIGLPAGYKENWTPSGENVLGWISMATEVVIVVAGLVVVRRRAIGVSLTGASRASLRPASGVASAVGRRRVAGRRLLPVAIFAALPVLVTACATRLTNGTALAMAAPTTVALSQGMSMAPGMSMAAGMSMAPATSVPSMSVGSAAPSASTQMICTPEIKKDVAQLLGLSAAPPTTVSWVGGLYTCTYHLSQGPLVLSVKESPDVATARQYFDATRQSIGALRPLQGITGLGLPAYEAPNGTVIFLKDNQTLQVDALGTPDHPSSQPAAAHDLAYTIATDVLACWNGQ